MSDSDGRELTVVGGVRESEEKDLILRHIEGDGDAFASGAGATAGRVMSLVGAGLLWLGLGLLLQPHPSIGRTAAIAACAVGAVVLVATIGFLHVGSGPALFLSLMVMIGHVARWMWGRRIQRLAVENGW